MEADLSDLRTLKEELQNEYKDISDGMTTEIISHDTKDTSDTKTSESSESPERYVVLSKLKHTYVFFKVKKIVLALKLLTLFVLKFYTILYVSYFNRSLQKLPKEKTIEPVLFNFNTYFQK